MRLHPVLDMRYPFGYTMLIFENPTWADIVPCMGSVLVCGCFLQRRGLHPADFGAKRTPTPPSWLCFLSLESVFGAVSGAIFLHETMTGKELIGCVLMLIAVVLAQLDLPLKKKKINLLRRHKYMTETILKIDGMMCSMCESHV